MKNGGRQIRTKGVVELMRRLKVDNKKRENYRSERRGDTKIETRQGWFRDKSRTLRESGEKLTSENTA